MEPLHPDLLQQIDRYIARTATDAERATVEHWIASEPGAGSFITTLQAAWDGRLGAGRRWDTSAAYRRGLERRTALLQTDHRAASVHRSVGKGRSSIAYPPATFVIRKVWTTVAVVAAAVAIFVLGRHTTHLSSDTGRSTVTRYATTPGERATITLPDGSRVILDVASELEVPMDFSHRNRTLRLTGEAMFTVVHHDGTPFTVLTGPIATRVLGTTFLVRRYATDSTTTVAVQSGKVAVRSVVLTAGNQLVVNQTDHVDVRPVDLGQFTFATGVLTLNYMPLAQAIPELDRWYDTDIRLGTPALATQGIRGRFVAGSLADLSAVLQLMFDVRVVRNGRVLTLFPRS